MANGQGFPGMLPEIVSGWAGDQLDLVPGEGFWDRIEQIAVGGEMTRGLDTAMHGRVSPRIWLFLHEPGRGELSGAVAMCFARELAFRDQAALVLDGDDREQALTRWVGRVEAEGWIDLARYGTSVLTSGIPLPFVGRRGYLLGVGSFAPTDLTGEEVDTLVTRLRRQADDLLIVAPADDLGRLWAPAAGIRILCWDRMTLDETAAAALADDFEQAGCPLTAVVSFQEKGAAEEHLVEKVLTETEGTTAPEPQEVTGDGRPEEVVAGTATGETEEPRATSASGTDRPPEDEEAGWRSLPLEESAAAASADPAPPEEEEGWEKLRPEPEPVPSRETSRIFWFGALVAVALIAVATVYYLKFVRVPTDVAREDVPVAVGEVGERPVMAVTAAADSSTPANGDSLAATAADSLAAAATDSSLPGEGEPGDETSAAPAAEELAAVEPPPEVVAETPTTGTGVAEAAGFDMTPYRGEVGAAGWALHVFSLPTAEATAGQVAELERRGFASEVRVVDLGAKGSWHRIYLGSFPSRTAAREAMPALLKKLRVDWAKPERF